jgi:molybdopterin converting factor small subunit
VVEVQIWGSLQQAADGQATVEVDDVGTIRALFSALASAYPGLEPHLEKGVSVSIDGQIFNDAWFEPIPDGSEVCILPRITGG